MKKKLLIWISIGILAAVGTLVAFWDALAVWIAPKTVLTAALHSAAIQLQERWERSPVSLAAECLEPEGLYSARLDLRTDSQLFGPIDYQIDLSVDTHNNRILAEGTVRTKENDLDLAVFLDRNYAAVSSGDFLEGGYYGITYDSFPEDIRSIPLISMFINDHTLTGWESAVSGIQKVMNQTYSLPELPEISPEALQDVLAAVLLLPGHVERDQILVNGDVLQGHRIDYSASGGEVLNLLSSLMNTGDGSDAGISASFWLYEDQLVKVSLRGYAGGNSISCSAELRGEENTITLRLARWEGGREQGICIRHSAIQEQGVLRESWSFFQDFNGTGEETRLAYTWEEASGRLTLDGEGTPVVSILKTDSGLTLKTEEFGKLWNNLIGTPGPDNKVACELTLGPGKGVTVPEYKNIDQWTLEDFLVLLKGIGGLFGLDRR